MNTQAVKLEMGRAGTLGADGTAIYKVFIKTDELGRLVAINSSAFLNDTSSWIEIDQGEGDRYHHAQGNYLTMPIITDEGVYRYKLVDGKAVERTAEEIQADIDAIPPPPPSAEERIKTLEAKLTALEPTVTALARDIADVKLRVPIAPIKGATI